MQSHLPTPFTKGGLSFSKNGLATIKYHWVYVQRKEFGGGLSIPCVKGLNNSFGNTTMTTTQSQSHLPTPITKGGLSCGKNDKATIKYHWVHVH